eukprot:gene7913-10006_t
MASRLLRQLSETAACLRSLFDGATMHLKDRLYPPLATSLVSAQHTPSRLSDKLLSRLDDQLSVFDTSILLMAVPKRRTSHSKKRMRMTTKYLENKSHYITCKHCGSVYARHHICFGCIKLWKEQQQQQQE